MKVYAERSEAWQGEFCRITGIILTEMEHNMFETLLLCTVSNRKYYNKNTTIAPYKNYKKFANFILSLLVVATVTY